jgi:hypothetical protein
MSGAQFIETDRGHINVAAIVRIYQRRTSLDKALPYWQRRQTVVEYRDTTGTACTAVAEDPTLDVEIFCAPVVPAAPGFYLVGVLEADGGGYEMAKLPVIGWRIPPGARGAIPVTIEDSCELSAILRPDGIVSDPFGTGTYPDLTTYRVAAIEELREEALAGGRP